MWQRLRIAVAIFAVLFAAACGSGGEVPVPTGPPQGASFAEQFDFMAQTFDREYSYFAHKQIDWNALRATFRPRAQQAATQAEFIQALRDMLVQLHDQHVVLMDPAGTRTATFTPQHFINFDHVARNQALARGTFTPLTPRLGFGRINGAVAYMAIDTWDAQAPLAQLDFIVDQFRNEPVIIIDVRANGGGNDQIALEFAGRFADRARTTEFVQFRNGPLHTDFAARQARQVTPRGTFQFTRQVILLAGRRCASSNESFISAMRELPHVTVIGDTTAGASGNPGTFNLANGWSFTVSRWIAFTAQLQVIEDHGIAPDIFVAVTAADLLNGRDPVIEHALTLIP